MKRKKIFTDPTFWLLVAVNGYLVYHYYQSPQAFTTLIWLFWSQGIIIGVFTFIDILTTPQSYYDQKFNNAAQVRSAIGALQTGADDNSPAKPPKKRTRFSLARAFFIPYFVLHVFYVIFIATLKPRDPIQWNVFAGFFTAFLFAQVVSFVQHKLIQRRSHKDDGNMFLLPFLRVLPMHLTIVLPAVFHFGSMLLFLVLRALLDIVMYSATRPRYASRAVDAATLASQQNPLTNV